jgi:hypothetical protein
VYVDDRLYGEASNERNDRVFFKRDYGVVEIDALFSAQPWTVHFREYVVQRRPRIEEFFYAGAPWTYVYGPLLRFVCPRNFVGSSMPSVLMGASHGVVHLRMEKQVARHG